METMGIRNKGQDDVQPEEEEEVDPRIQGELEKLNQSTDDINRREIELEEARQKFRSVLTEATLRLDEMVKKIGKSVEDSKPYWEARKVARQAQLEAQKATQDFQRATEVLRAAKETISLAEQRLLEDEKRQFDSAWQEMLNHATQRVMEEEQKKTRSELVHKETAAKYNAAMGRMKQLEKKLKRSINKSKPYFEMKAKYYLQLEQLKKTVDELQAKLSLAKGEYKTALKNLEMISDEIHERRRSSAMGPRGRGVGAEGSNSVEDLSACKLESDTISKRRAVGGTQQFHPLQAACRKLQRGRIQDRSPCARREDSSDWSVLKEMSALTQSFTLDYLTDLEVALKAHQDSMTSEVFEDDNLNSVVSEEDSETQSLSSYCSDPTSPSEILSPFPGAPRPGSLDLSSPMSLSEFGLISPVLGPRSECSGASSPECDMERGNRAEGSESKAQDRLNNNSNIISKPRALSALDNSMKHLSLDCADNEANAGVKCTRSQSLASAVLVNAV